MDEKSNTAIKAMLNAHKFSCKDLINGYINRIKLYDLTVINNKAPLNAITAINPKAIADAEKLDAKIKNKNELEKTLFCVPVIVKDNVDVRGMQTSSGSLSLLGTFPLADAVIVHSIKQSDGIILAKSSMNELAAGIDGISSLSGRIGNAYNTSYSAGGSSGGSAVSIAAGFAPMTIGSDNSGSIRIPAAYNGIYGLRPTYGLIGHAGIFPMGNLDGTIGPMASNVNDLAILLTVMTNNKNNYAESLNVNSLSGKHFAIVKSIAGESLWTDMPKPIADIYQKVIANLQKEGVIISEIDLPQYNLDRQNNMAGTVDDVNYYLTHNISSVSELRQACNGNSRVFGTQQHCLKFIDSIKSKNSPEYKQVVRIISKNQAYVLNIMRYKHLDGVVFPSSKSGIASDNWHKIGDAFIISSNSGLPEITLPVAQYNGLPVGLEIMSKKYDEKELLNYAFAYQKHFYSFQAPQLVADTKFSTWSIGDLNVLYLTMGEISFNTVIKPSNKNEVSPKQSVITTQKAIATTEINY